MVEEINKQLNDMTKCSVLARLLDGVRVNLGTYVSIAELQSDETFDSEVQMIAQFLSKLSDVYSRRLATRQAERFAKNIITARPKL